MVIKENASLTKALKVINENSKNIVFLENKSKEIVASLSDGDIRRHLKESKDLCIQIDKIANYSFRYVKQNEITKARKIMLKNKINCLPVLNEEKKITSVVFIKDFNKLKTLSIVSKALKIPVVIMAGGKGTRLKPYSDILPKPLIPIGNVTITERIIERFLDFGINNFTMIVNHKRDLVKAYFNGIKNKNYKLEFIDESRPLKTGGGLGFLKSIMKETFFMTNCDIIVDGDYEKFYKKHKQEKNIMTFVCAQKNLVLPYGTIQLDSKKNILSFEEKPKMRFLTNTGFYIIEPEFLNFVPNNKAIDITDMIKVCIKLKKKIGIAKISEEAWHDMGQHEELLRMIDFFGE
jgi:dTDP-glucose pyrophosphorylase